MVENNNTKNSLSNLNALMSQLLPLPLPTPSSSSTFHSFEYISHESNNCCNELKDRDDDDDGDVEEEIKIKFQFVVKVSMFSAESSSNK